MNYLRQSTSVDVGIGPFVDSTDGVTAETALTITQPDVRLKKNGGAWAQKAAAQTLSHEENGWYEVTLDATDTNTVGILIAAVNESGALPVWREFQVVEEAVYDRDYAASATGIVGTAQTGDSFARLGAPAGASVSADVAAVKVDTAAILVDTGTTLDARIPAALVSGRMDSSVGAMAANTLTATAINADAFTAAKFAADVTTELQSGLATAANLATLQTSVNTVDDFLDTEMAAVLAAVDTEVAAIKAVTDLLPDAGALTSLATAANLATVDTVVDAILVDTGTTLDAALATVDTVVDAIKVQSDKLVNLPVFTAGGTGGQGFGAP